MIGRTLTSLGLMVALSLPAAAGASAQDRVLELVSTGSAGGNGAVDPESRGLSADGTRAFFQTEESLVSADSDAQTDVYERAGGQTTLVSTGPAGGNGSTFALFEGASDDGSRVFFWTHESLVSGDTDATRDLYERAGGQTTLVSTGTLGGNGGVHVSLDGAGLSSDGSRVFFVTFESLVSADTDQVDDLYERAGGQTTLVSTGPAGSDGNSFASFGGASADGSRVFFVTDGSLVSADTDGWTDVYQRADGQTTLVSTGPAGGNGNAEALFARASADGSRVVFNTTDALVSADTDATWDVYERAGAESTLVSTGPAGNGNAAAWFTGASADATRVFFDTAESLVSADTDTEWDVYERSGGQTTLVSTGPAGGNGNAEAWFMDVSVDGTRALFGTAESLLSSDTDSAEDMYLSRVLLPEVATPPAPAPGPGGAPAPAPAPAAPSPLLGACANLRTGTAGRDTLTGGAFGDRLRGLAGNDVLAGRAGDDCLNGGGGHDRLRGGAGNDRINARDGRRETVRCGAGKDRVTADRGDRTIGCERIARR